MSSNDAVVGAEAAAAFLTSSSGGYLAGDDAHSIMGDGTSVDGGYRTLGRRALDIKTLTAYVKDTQPEEWAAFVGQHPTAPEATFANAVQSAVNGYGIVAVLRNGFELFDRRFRLVGFEPDSSGDDALEACHRRNVCRCIRGFRPSAKDDDAIDLVLDVNGIPLVGIEFADTVAGQTVEDAEARWRARSPHRACFKNDNRLVAAFAVGADEVELATCLEGDRTEFVPFSEGAGAPAHLLEQALQRDRLLDIVQTLLYVEHRLVPTVTPHGTSNVIMRDRVEFPGAEQLEMVRVLDDDAAAHGAGRVYLLEQPDDDARTGAIARAAYRLALVQDGDADLFGSVVVLSERRVSDGLLKDAMEELDHRPESVHVVGAGTDGVELTDALRKGVRLIVCSPRWIDAILEEAADGSRRFALIVEADEGDAAEGGEDASAADDAPAAADAVAEDAPAVDAPAMDGAEQAPAADDAADAAPDAGTVMDAASAAPAPISKDDLMRRLAAHRGQANLSILVLSAEPDERLLAAFGTPREDGSAGPFHARRSMPAPDGAFEARGVDGEVPA